MEVGVKYNRLTLVNPDTGKRLLGKVCGIWRCDCGVEKEIKNNAVSCGGTKSCGCLHRETASLLGKKSMGKRLSLETIRKVSEALKGRQSPNKGRSPSEETRKKMIAARLGKSAFWNVGRRHTEETKKKNSISHIGQVAWNKGINHIKISAEKSHLWKGGITPINAKLRHSVEYKKWRIAVLSRDNHTCQFCKEKESVSVKLNADHIMPFALFPELRFELSNGRTLCEDCHKKTDTYLFKMNGKAREDYLAQTV